jgi:hypothetical protein
MLKKTFRRKKEELTAGRRKLNDKELHNFYCSGNIVKVIRSREVKWSGHIADGDDMQSVVKTVKQFRVP